MIKLATKILENVGPLLVAVEKQGLEGKSQKEIAEAINRSEAWVSRRVQVATEHDLIEIKEIDQWGQHKSYDTWAKWKANTIHMKEKGKKAVETILALDPILAQCPSCNEIIDVIGYSGNVECPFCGSIFQVEGIEPPSPRLNIAVSVGCPLIIGSILVAASLLSSNN